MSSCRGRSAPLLRCVDQFSYNAPMRGSIRTLSLTARTRDTASVESSISSAKYDPETVTNKEWEREMIAAGIQPIGSRRRRAALKTSANIPFEKLPYQCFQEARSILKADREEKIQQIENERARIARLVETNGTTVAGGEAGKQRRLRDMRAHLEKLKILADINDPLIKKRFEDGQGDMNRPIYRHLAEKKWKAYRKLLLDQRIDQLSIVPDMLPKMEVIADIKLRFASRNVHPGDFVDSRVSEQGPHLAVQVFDKGERLVTVAVVDPDVPDVQRDGFNYRCHYLAVNVPLSPTSSAIHIADPEARFEVALPWLPPMVQKGDKYHRLVVFILQQPESARLDSKKIVGSNTSRTNFKLRSLIDKASLKPISAYVFRSNWDEGTDGVMERAGVEGADLEYRRRRIESLVKVQLPIKKKVNRPGLPTKRLSLPTRPFRRRMKS